MALIEGGNFDFTRIVLVYAIVFFGDLSTHYSNDYFDFEVDKNIDKERHFSGSGILVRNAALRPAARLTSITLMAISIGLAIIAVSLQKASIELLIITLGAVLLGWIYSAPPFRLVSKGLGESVIAVGAGFVIPSLGYLSVMNQLNSFFACFIFPFLMYGLTLGLSLEIADLEVDRQGGKRNIVVRYGEKFVIVLIFVVNLLATLGFGIFSFQFQLSEFNFGIVTLFSLIPLTASIIGLLKIFQEKKLDFSKNLCIASLFLFNIITITYLLYLLYGLAT